MNFNNFMNNINTEASIANLANININMPMPTMSMPTIPSVPSHNEPSCLPIMLSPNRASSLFPIPTQTEVAHKNKQIQLMQSRLWSLQTAFDEAINVIQTFKDNEDNKQLCTIQEEEDEDTLKLRARNTLLEQELADLKKAHSEQCDEFSLQIGTLTAQNTALQKELTNSKRKMKDLEYEKSVQDNKKQIKQSVLSALYLNSNRVKEFMKMVKQYGSQYETLKKRQCNLTNAIGMEDNETVKIRMNGLYHDIVKVEHIYDTMYDALDVIKTESQGKEYQLMTKDKEYIALLEKERFVQSSHLEEYVKRNQSLQTDLTDREMKLRQSQNELTFVKQKFNQLQVSNNNYNLNQNGYQNYQYNFCENY